MAIRFDSGNNGGSNFGGGGGSIGGKGGCCGGCLGLVVLLIAAMFGLVDLENLDLAENEGDNEFNTEQRDLGTGMSFDPEKYEQVEIFEPLAVASSAGRRGTQLPRRHSLRRFAPKPRSQGRQGSCVGWASAYAARTVLQAAATGENPNNIVFSPAYVFNSIKDNVPKNRRSGSCEGSYNEDALKFMMSDGAVPWSAFPYNVSDCNNKPDANLKRQAQNFRIRGYNRLTEQTYNRRSEQWTSKIDLNTIKQNLVQNAPVLFGMYMPSSLDHLRKAYWRASPQELTYRGGGHAMCIIGYDDDYEGRGAFEVMNSWDSNWGDGGFFWLDYESLENLIISAYGLYPLAQQVQPKQTGKFKALIGLNELNSGQPIPVELQNQQGLAATARPLAKNTRFRVEVTNESECYTYIFGRELTGESYTLFPYTERHSPYSGIVGTRLFPRDGMESLRVDEDGTEAFMAVVLSNHELDLNAINRSISRSRKGQYEEALREALSKQLPASGFNYSKDRQGLMQIQTRSWDNNKAQAVYLAIRVDKR